MQQLTVVLRCVALLCSAISYGAMCFVAVCCMGGGAFLLKLTSNIVSYDKRRQLRLPRRHLLLLRRNMAQNMACNRRRYQVQILKRLQYSYFI